MLEKNIQTLFGNWLKTVNLRTPACFELKLEKGKSFAVDKVAEHQIYYLRRAKLGLYYKIPDMFSADGYASRKPFDTFWMVTNLAMVVLVFYTPRKSKRCYFIDVDAFETLKTQILPRKSLTMELLDSSPLVSLICDLGDSNLSKLDSLVVE